MTSRIAGIDPETLPEAPSPAMHVIAMMVGLLILPFARMERRRPPKPESRSAAEIVSILRAFLAGTVSFHRWMSFVFHPITEPELERIRQRCRRLHTDFPTRREVLYCSDEGVEVVRDCLRELERAS